MKCQRKKKNRIVKYKYIFHGDYGRKYVVTGKDLVNAYENLLKRKDFNSEGTMFYRVVED